MTRRATALLLVLTAPALASLSLAGCSASGTASDLEDVRWKMTSLAIDGETAEALPDADVTAAFDGGTVSGSGGCNSYSAAYVTEGSAIEIGPAAATLMACPEPVMGQEQAFFAALDAAAEYRVTETELVLLDGGDGEVLSFEAAEPVALEGTTWVATGITNGREAVVSVVQGSEVTALFDGVGEVSGSAGCNSYGGSFEAEDDSISIGPLAATEMYCEEPEGVMEQEQAFLAAMQNVAVYELAEDQLTLRDADGAAQVTFVAE